MPGFIDRTGQKYGHWTALERATSVVVGGIPRTMWKCRCDCGVEKILRSEVLSSKQRQGCFSCVVKDRVAASEAKEAGKTYGFWTVVKRARTRNGIAKWVCKCVCGTKRSLQIGALKSGQSKSCGCHNSTSEERVFLSRKATYIYAAESRGLSWTISDKEAVEVLFSPCFYCGRPPSRTLQGYSVAKRHKNVLVGGIDRIDNSKGYVPNNIRPCCRVCNIAKSTLTSDEFKQWVSEVYNHFVLGENKNVDNGRSSSGIRIEGSDLKILREEVYGYRRRSKPRREIEVRLPIHGSIENGAVLFAGSQHGQSSEIIQSC